VEGATAVGLRAGGETGLDEVATGAAEGADDEAREEEADEDEGAA